MADVKISQLTALASASSDVAADVLAIVDTSVPQTKKITIENLVSPITLDKSNSRIGIGTSSPAQILDVQGGRTHLKSNDEYNLRLYASNGDSGKFIGTPAGDKLSIYSDVGNAEVTVDASGNVGIGVTSPASLLHVKTTADASETIRIQNDDSLTTVGVSSDGYSFHTYQHSLYWASWDGSTWSTKARLDSNGNLGLGTTSINSNAKLHIRGGDSGQTSSSNNTQLTVEGSGSGGIQILTGTTNVGGLWIGDSNGSETGGKLYYSNNDDSWQFYNAGSTNSLNIVSRGDVGIGDSAPTTALTNFGSASRGLSIKNVQPTIALTDTDTGSGHFWIANAGGISYFQNNVSGSTYRFYVETLQAFTINNDGESIFKSDRNGTAFQIINDHSSGPYGLKIDFDSATPNSSTEYFITCQDSTNDKFVVNSNGDVKSRTNSYGAISDERLKENIEDATPKLDELNQVRIVNFNFKDDSDKKQIGVVAQELQKIFPKMVDEYGEDGYLGVKYSIFVPMLIKSVQELSAKVKELEGK